MKYNSIAMITTISIIQQLLIIILKKMSNLHMLTEGSSYGHLTIKYIHNKSDELHLA